MKEYIEKGRNDLCVVKDVDAPSGIIVLYGSAFGNVDSDNDIIEPGAFAKTIKENGPDSTSSRIKSLLFHDPTKIPGKITELVEDNVGLKATVQLSKRTTLGKDTIGMYEDGLITEHSVGMNVLDTDNSGDSRIIKEAKLWEISGVTWGANSQTPMVSFKSLGKNVMIERISKIEKALHAGHYTDDTFQILELQLQQIKHYLNSIEEPSPPQDTTKGSFGDKITLLTNYLK